MTTKYEIKKFNENNFSLWIEDKAILGKDNCLVAIKEKTVKITHQKWKEMNDNAISNLHLAMADAILSSIIKKTTTKEICDTFIKLYEVKSLHTRIFLKRKYSTLFE